MSGAGKARGCDKLLCHRRGNKHCSSYTRWDRKERAHFSLIISERSAVHTHSSERRVGLHALAAGSEHQNMSMPAATANAKSVDRPSIIVSVPATHTDGGNPTNAMDHMASADASSVRWSRARRRAASSLIRMAART